MNIKYIHSVNGGNFMTDKKTDIFNSARELFYSKGYKETNVSEIANMAGIGVGTFYNYYSSKEQLFLEVYIKENEDLKKRLIKNIDINDEPITLVTKFITHNILSMNSNRILKEWYNKELFGKLEQYFDKQSGVNNIQEFMHSGAAELIKKWKAERKIRIDIDDEMILAIFNSIPFIDLHKNDIGIEHFPQILYYITEFVMKGLTDCPK